MTKCVYMNCSNKKSYKKGKEYCDSGPSLSFFSFPANIEQCQICMSFCSENFKNRNFSFETLFKKKTHKICELHFKKTDFINNYDGAGRKFLRKSANPHSSTEQPLASSSTVSQEVCPLKISCKVTREIVKTPEISNEPSKSGSRVSLKRPRDDFDIIYSPIISSNAINNSPRIRRALYSIQSKSANSSPASKRSQTVPAVPFPSSISSTKSLLFSPNTLALNSAAINLNIEDISPDAHVNTLTEEKRKLKSHKRNVYYIKKSRITKCDIINKLHGHISPLLLNILDLELAKKTKSQSRYSLLLKQYALAIHLQSPVCYRLLQSIFPLPCPQLLHTWIQRLRFVPGFDPALFSLMKTRAKISEPKAKYCFLLMDEIFLKKSLKYRERLDSVIGFEDYGDCETSSKIASSALVFMARGIIIKWKQPVAFVYTAGGASSLKLEELMKTCITKIGETGFLVMGICTDQGANFHSLFKRLKVTVEKPYFEFEGKKRLVIVDPPHLVKSARNALLDNFVQTPSGVAEWEYILKMYRFTKLRSISVIHKLSDDHVSPPKFGGKMKVKLATQVLSRSVACALETCLTLGLDITPDEAYATADYCRNFNKLFDICNSSTLKVNYEPNRSLRKETKRYEFLKVVNSNFLDRLIIIDPKTGKSKNSSFKFVTGWKQTVNAILLLMDALEKEDVKTLQTRSLYQDPLENLFGQIRLKNSNPCCYQFQLSFGELCFSDLLKRSIQGNSNCEQDDNVLFLDLQTFLTKENAGLINVGLNFVEYEEWLPKNMEEDLFYQNTMNYIGGYFIYLLCKQHDVENCDKCVSCLSKEHTDLTSLYTIYKTFDYESGHTAHMKVCSQSFMQYVNNLEQLFCREFPKL